MNPQTTVTNLANGEVFALTDEQILGLAPDEAAAPSADERAGESAQPSTSSVDGTSSTAETRTRALAPQAEPPGWLAERMRDPRLGEEARGLWEGSQNAQREAAAYREAFGTPEEARALKEIYPGGAAQAKAAAERAGALAEIDAAFFGAPGKSPEELRAGRTQLVERLYTQDPAAFREMAEAARQILERAGATQPPAVSIANAAPNATPPPSSTSPVPNEVANLYREFERATNADLEKSVGAAIGKAMEAALPNLKQAERTGVSADGQPRPLQERLAAAVREEVEAALKSDAALGEQVARVLGGRRFDQTSRGQVVRLIDTRAQQLIPGAVRRVVGSWTAATLGSQKPTPAAEKKETTAAVRSTNGAPHVLPDGRVAPNESRNSTPHRVDYRKWSDEQILDM